MNILSLTFLHEPKTFTFHNKAIMQKITPFFWYDGQAEEAANFYTSIFPNSKVDGVFRQGEQVMTVGFTLDGQKFTALNGGPLFKFTEAVSFVVNCKGQAEVDYFWEKLTADGGQESQCGWLKDKFGMSWQIVPVEMFQLFADPDPIRSQRAMGAMMKMQKIDLEAMRQAADDENATAVVSVEAIMEAPMAKVWKAWTTPADIMQWNNASPDWHTPRAENDLRTGGSFSSRMEAKDGSFGFDFGGVYDQVVEHKIIAYTMSDGRKVEVHFTEMEDGKTHVFETFDAEGTNPVEMQMAGWQAILDNFKRYVESN